MDDVFFWFSKLIWLIISPDNLIVILIFTITVLIYLGKDKIAKYLLISLSTVLFILTLFPVGEWLLYPLETHFQTNPVLTDKIDGIIVLSGSEDAYMTHLWNQVEVGNTVERDLNFIRLAKLYPRAKLIFSGGTGSLTRQEFKSADVAKRLFQELDFDISRIVFERDSRNTYENAIFSYKKVQPKSSEKWVLITTAWHMPRSVGLFCQINWPVIPYPVDHQTDKNNLLRINFDFLGNLSVFKTSLKEWLGLIAYYVSGKTTSVLPMQCSPK